MKKRTKNTKAQAVGKPVVGDQPAAPAPMAPTPSSGDDGCPRCGSESWHWDEGMECFDCYHCGLVETETENKKRRQNTEVSNPHPNNA